MRDAFDAKTLVRQGHFACFAEGLLAGTKKTVGREEFARCRLGKGEARDIARKLKLTTLQAWLSCVT